MNNLGRSCQEFQDIINWVVIETWALLPWLKNTERKTEVVLSESKNATREGRERGNCAATKLLSIFGYSMRRYSFYFIALRFLLSKKMGVGGSVVAEVLGE